MRIFRIAPRVRLVAAALAVAAPVVCAAEEKEASDRVGFPRGYESFEVVRIANKTQKTLLGTIYANAAAATIKETGQLPYPDGSVIVMEWAEPLRGSDGTLLTGSDGLWRKGKVVRVDVMRRGPGFGEIYGERRSGQWEFASYALDGSILQPPATAGSCAECHQKAGPARDFVFCGRFPPAEKK